MQRYDLQVKFIAETDMAASQSASQLHDALEQRGFECDVLADENTQDAGAIIGIILGSAALIEVARGIADFIRRYNVSDIEFEGKSGVVRVSNVRNKDISELVEKISEVVK